MSERLNVVLRHAYENSEFYKDILNIKGLNIQEIISDWSKVPIINKNEIIQAEKPIMPYRFMLEQNSGSIEHMTTSGSTGKCLTTYWRRSDQTKSLLTLCLARKQNYNIISSDRFCYFYTIREIGSDEMKSFSRRNELGFSKTNLTQMRIEEIYNQMLEFQPVWMVLQPSIAMILSRYVVENDAEPIESLRYIELTGEMCLAESRKFIEYAFDCPTASQYGAHEVNSIAYECPCGNMHVMSDNVLVEVIKDGKLLPDGEEGEIVVTSLNNYAMPFIRYNIGDYGILHPNTCSCGNKGKILKLTKGRKNDNIRFADGTTANAYEFVRIFDCMSYQIDGQVYQYHIKQIDYKSFEVHIVTDEKEELIKSLFNDNQVNMKLKNANYNFIFHSQLFPDDTTGKLNAFECII